MGRVGDLRTTRTWPELLKDLQEVMQKWDKSDYLMPTKAKSETDGCVTFSYAIKGKWSEPLKSGRFRRPEENLAAIVLALDAVRKADQRGLGHLIAAASAPLALTGRSQRTPHEVLGLSPSATPEQIKSAYMEKLKATHPDTGGNAEEFKAVMHAAEMLGLRGPV